MIGRLYIRNFQCHRKLIKVFDEKVSVITGTSNSGKSAIIRALYWLYTNKPRGKAFIRHTTDHALVSLHVNGHVIKRLRSKDRNIYMLDDVQFEAMGSGVPEQVQKALRVIPDITFQRQHDPPFMLSMTSGECGSFVSKIAKLEGVQECIAYLKERDREQQTKYKEIEIKRGACIATIKESREVLSALDVLYQKWEQASSDLKDTKDRKAQVEDALHAVQKIQKNPLWHVPISEVRSDLETITGSQNRLQGLHKNRVTIARAISAIEKANTLVKDRMPSDFTSKIERYIGVMEQKKRLGLLLTELEDKQKKVDDLVTQKEVLKGAMIGRECPLCGNLYQ
jgi:exonuclease SbcC